MENQTAFLPAHDLLLPIAEIEVLKALLESHSDHAHAAAFLEKSPCAAVPTNQPNGASPSPPINAGRSRWLATARSKWTNLPSFQKATPREPTSKLGYG